MKKRVMLFEEFLNESYSYKIPKNKRGDFIIGYVSKNLDTLKDVLDVRKFPNIKPKYYDTLNYMFFTEFGFVTFTDKILLRLHNVDTNKYYEIYNSDLLTGMNNDLGIDFKKDMENALKVHFSMLGHLDISKEIDLDFYKGTHLNVTPYIHLRNTNYN